MSARIQMLRTVSAYLSLPASTQSFIQTFVHALENNFSHNIWPFQRISMYTVYTHAMHIYKFNAKCLTIDMRTGAGIV